MSRRRRRGRALALRDPRERLIAPRVAEAGRDAARLYEALSSLPGLFAPELAASGALRAAVVPLLAAMLEHGMAGAIARQG